jgi:hypothetical protein
MLETFKTGDAVSFTQYSNTGVKMLCLGEVERMYAYPCSYLVKLWTGGAYIQHASTLTRIPESEAFLHKLEL